MSQQPTEKCRYPSPYSPGGWVSGPQYIIELICEAKARKEKKDLPVKFWNLKEWASYYKSQLRCVYSLLKKYDEAALINTLRNNKGIYSLRADFVIRYIEKEQAAIKAKKEKPKIEVVKETVKVDNVSRPKQKSNNLLDKLEELDG